MPEDKGKGGFGLVIFIMLLAGVCIVTVILVKRRQSKAQYKFAKTDSLRKSETLNPAGSFFSVNEDPEFKDPVEQVTSDMQMGYDQ